MKIFNLFKYLISVIVVFIFMFIIASGNKREKVVVSDINSIKNMQVAHFVYKYNNLLEKIEPKRVINMKEALLYGETQPIDFIGTLTGYGPDCVGCLGKVYCAPWPYVTNGRITYDDAIFGTVRIVAADYAVPCGSIVKISNFNFIDGDFLAIVLDRGSSIVGNTMDLLYESEEKTVVIGRQRDIRFEIVRWGW